jgi:hypothetical protein
MRLKISMMIGTIITILAIPISSLYAGGPRLDWPEDSSNEGKDCWVEGYDAGFAGKYDKGRADECANEGDEYNRSWDGACKDAGYTKDECDGFKNKPGVIENHESLIILIIQLVQNSYTILLINDQLKVEFVLAKEIQDHMSFALKNKILKDTVSLLMIQSFVRLLEISAMRMVL